MNLTEIRGRRAESAEPLRSRWKPIDIMCDAHTSGEDSPPDLVLVRAKLVRDAQSAAVCVSEAVSHRVFIALGVLVAEAFAVALDAEFARSLSAQFAFDPAVIPGRHWGTRLIVESDEDVFNERHYELLVDQTRPFLIYLADVVLGYRDRHNHGNVLFVPAAGGDKLDMIPIDQSDCFSGPGCLCSPDLLQSERTKSIARPFVGMERLAIDGGPTLVDTLAHRVLGARRDILDAVSAPPDEWYGRAGLEPDHLYGFLEYRLDHLGELARLDYWRGMSSAAGGDYVLL